MYIYIYIRNQVFVCEKKWASNFVLESLRFFFKGNRRITKPSLCNFTLHSDVAWRKIMYHTLGTIYALVAILTGTSIVIYSCIPTRRTVFARIRFTVVDIWKREINGGKFTICTRTSVYISEIKFSCQKRKELPTSFLSHCISSLREAIQGHA